jgi:hypothetical protein
VPRLEPGTLCTDDEGGFCSTPAESLCRACGRPLCDRHNDPRRVYWHARLDWRVLCPSWTAEDRAEWARLNAPLSGFPAPGVEPPFEWRRHERDSRQAVGFLEYSALEQVRPIVKKWAGDANENGCLFDGVCGECVTEAEEAVSEAVESFAVQYRQVALRERLAALRAEYEQALRYVESVLGRAPLASIKGEEKLPSLDGLDSDSPRRDWDRWGIRLREQLEAIDRFAPRVGACGEDPTAT